MSAVAYSGTGEPLRRRARAASHGKLYFGTAVSMAAVAFAGFVPSYWAPLAAGTLALHPAVHFHGVLFFLWMLYFVAQTALVADGRTGWHRELGLFGIALAAVMAFSGILVQIVSLAAGLQGPQPEVARYVAALGFSAMLMFTTFVALAIANVRRPEIHRRLMVLASFAIIGAAVVRLVRLVPGMTTLAERVLLGTVIVDGLLVALVLLDRRTVGRVHPCGSRAARFSSRTRRRGR
ncbi:MAG TPA: hypothetical protein VF329_07070 [Gammaproteobacteria bacterium]